MLKPGVTDDEGALLQGQVGTITTDDEDGNPYKVIGPSGSISNYLRENEVQCPITTSSTGTATTALALCRVYCWPLCESRNRAFPSL